MPLLAEALYDGGVRLLEVTFDACGKKSDAETAADIKTLAKKFKGRMYIGAGTVLTEKQVRLTKKAGGSFIISPNTDKGVITESRMCGLVSIPGVKTVSETLENADIMRGEETELMGLDIDISDSLILLPGSHSKCISVSKDGRINEFHTFLTGEMLYAISNATILSRTVDLSVAADKEYLIKGYKYCEKHGINEALFKTCILDMLFSCTPAQRMGFFTGVILYGEISRIIKFSQKRVIIAGKRELKYSMAHLLEHFFQKEVICVSDTAANNAPALGAVKIYTEQ